MEDIDEKSISYKTYSPRVYEDFVRKLEIPYTKELIDHLMDLHIKALNEPLVLRALCIIEREERRKRRQGTE